MCGSNRLETHHQAGPGPVALGGKRRKSPEAEGRKRKKEEKRERAHGKVKERTAE